MKKLFWFEWLAAFLFVLDGLLTALVTPMFPQGNALPSYTVITILIIIGFLADGIVLMSVAAANPRGFAAVKFGVMGFSFLSFVFMVYSATSFWQVMYKEALFSNVPAGMAGFMIASIISFTLYALDERHILIEFYGEKACT